jgi:hypothetical protein
MNMFTGVVVESFAYVYQRPGGVSVNREDISQYLLCTRTIQRLDADNPRGVQEGLVIHRHRAYRLHQAKRLYSFLLGKSFYWIYRRRKIISDVVHRDFLVYLKSVYTLRNTVSQILSVLLSPTHISTRPESW